MTDSKIDWSKALEDAQYCYNHLWYKIEGGEVWVASDNGYWLYSTDWSIDDNLDNNPKFIKRPASSGQSVSVKVETCSVEAGSIKPPLGLTPKSIWEERMQHQRRQDIHAAMQRYIEAGKEIPNDWLEELIEVNNVLAKIEKDFDEAIQSLPVKDKYDWIKNTQTVDSFPSCLGEDTKIKVELRHGAMLIGNASDWSYSWNTSNDAHNYIVRYCIIQE